MKHIILHQDALLGPWIAKRADAQWNPYGSHCIGLAEDSEIIAGVLFESYNGANMSVHVAAIPGRRWLDRKFLWICFDYPFNQLKCRRLTGLVPARNFEARRFDEHLGFVREGKAERFFPNGDDLIIYCMFREDCKWLKLSEKFNVATSKGAERSLSTPNDAAVAAPDPGNAPAAEPSPWPAGDALH